MIIPFIILQFVFGGLGASVTAAWQEPADWQELRRAVAIAAERNVHVLVYVQAPWCGPCRQLETDVFPQLTPLLERFALAALQFDRHDDSIPLWGKRQSSAAWARDVGATATPTIVILKPDGTVVMRIPGYVGPRDLKLALAYVASRAYERVEFAEYVQQTPIR